MSTNGLLDLVDIRQHVADSFVAQMLASTPDRQEKVLRLLINRMSRAQIDILYVAQNLYVDSPINQSTNTIQESEA